MNDGTSLQIRASNPAPAPFEAAPLQAGIPVPAPSRPEADSQLMLKGWIQLDGLTLRRLRLSRYMSQQDLANDCWHRDIRVSIATIKRAECGHPVRFRIARELSRCFGVPVEQLLRLSA